MSSIKIPNSKDKCNLHHPCAKIPLWTVIPNLFGASLLYNPNEDALHHVSTDDATGRPKPDDNWHKKKKTPSYAWR